MFKTLSTALLYSICVIFGLSQAQAQQPAPGPGLQMRIDALLPDAGQHGFELGLLTVLRGVEKSLQSRYEVGLGDEMRVLPLFRLGTGEMPNPAAEPAGPDALSKIVLVFLDDLAQSQAYLSDGPQPFELVLQSVWFDVNANDAYDQGEDAVTMLAPIVLGRRALREMEQAKTLKTPITIRFDEADHAWLSAYTHMLSGFGNLFLAFDPTDVLRDLAAGREALKS
ncbi:MAG: hypothetical protein WBC90_05885, partial [Albidovulum sp.]